MIRILHFLGLQLALSMMVVSSGAQAGGVYFHPFHEGLALVEIDAQTGTWNGFIDRDGNWVIKPRQNFFRNGASYFSDGLALAQASGKDGYVDSSAQWVIKPQYESSGKFSEGLAAAKINGKWGYIDLKGKWAIKPQFESAATFGDGLALVKAKQMYAYINRAGKAVINTGITDMGYLRNYSEGLARVRDKESDKEGYIDHSGKWVFGPQIKYGSDFGDGMAYVEVDAANEGYIGLDGKWVIKQHFHDASEFSEGLARVRINSSDKYGYIDRGGNWAIEPQFDGPRSKGINGDSGTFSEGLAVAEVNGETGYIDLKGKWVIAPEKLKKLVEPYATKEETKGAGEEVLKMAEGKPNIKECVPPAGTSRQYSDSCVNGDCVRTFSNGCQKHIQAARCFDPVRSEWVWKPDGC